MIWLSTALSFLIFSASAAPAPSSFGSAIDFSDLITTAQYQCFSKNNIYLAFIRVFNPAGQGSFDQNSCQNIRNLASTHIKPEIYMTPSPMATTAPATSQIDAVISGLKACGLYFGRLWIQVTNPHAWSSDVVQNNEIITALVDQAYYYKLMVGIYSNPSDWQTITGGYPLGYYFPYSELWYYNTTGTGDANQSPQDFNDFTPFGGWAYPVAKQYSQMSAFCGVYVDRSIVTYTAFPAK